MGRHRQANNLILGERMALFKEAKSLGYSELSLKTENKGSLYSNRKWKYIGKGIDKYGQKASLYEYTLSDRRRTL